MEGKTHVMASGDDARSESGIQRRRQRSWEVDVHRARALRGDALEELTESQREWVWRSLLRGVRLAQATKLAQLAPEETPQALQQVVSRYSALMDQRGRERQAQRDAPGMNGASRATDGHQLDSGIPE